MNFQQALQNQAVAIRKLAQRVSSIQAGIGPAIQGIAEWLASRPPSITEEIDRIPGRRLEFRLSGEVDFDISVEGSRGEPITFQVSQDGPFIMTHYPLVLWRPTAPDTATNFGRWRPVTSYPLPDQVYDTDVIDLSFELFDGGSERMMQSAASGPIFSRPDNLIPLPVPTMFASAASIQFFPTYNQITFDGAVAPTDGALHVDLIGYRIANL